LIDSQLTYYVFAPDQTHEVSAAFVRDYIEANRIAWEEDL